MCFFNVLISQNQTNFSLYGQASTCSPDTVCKGWEEIGKEVANDQDCPKKLRFLSSINRNCHSHMAGNLAFSGDWLCSGYRDAKKTQHRGHHLQKSGENTFVLSQLGSYLQKSSENLLFFVILVAMYHLALWVRISIIFKISMFSSR